MDHRKELFVFLCALLVFVWCVMLWRQDIASAEWQDAYREGYQEGATAPGEDGIRGGRVTVPTPPTPRNAETDGQAFARGARDGYESQEDEDNQEEDEE